MDDDLSNKTPHELAELLLEAEEEYLRLRLSPDQSPPGAVAKAEARLRRVEEAVELATKRQSNHFSSRD